MTTTNGPTCATHGCEYRDGKCIRCWGREQRPSKEQLTQADMVAATLYAAIATVDNPIACETMRRAAQWIERTAHEPAAVPSVEPIARVINNNQPGWTNIVETEPNVTLDVGAPLYSRESVMRLAAALAGAIHRADELEAALRCYRDEYTGHEPSVSMFDRMVDKLIGPAPPPRALLADEVIAWQCACGWINLDRESPFCAGCDNRRPSPTKEATPGERNGA